MTKRKDFSSRFVEPFLEAGMSIEVSVYTCAMVWHQIAEGAHRYIAMQAVEEEHDD